MTIKGYLKHQVYRLLGPDYWAMDNIPQQSENRPAIEYNCPKNGIKYIGNNQIDMSNINAKIKQMEEGVDFETSWMLTQNNVIGLHFLDSFSNLVNVGCGVGTFENCHAPNFPDVQFCSIDYDKDSIDWCQKNRPFPNVEYRNCTMKDLIAENKKYSLAISIDVIEHLSDYKGFLDELSSLSDTAIISTPNRDRYDDVESLVKPPYMYHVQEFNAGELFFILKMYYKNVTLFTLNKEKAILEEVGLYNKCPVTIAYCQK